MAVSGGFRCRAKGILEADVAQKELEVILARQLTSYLSIPAFIVDPDGTLLYYNEAAEAVLGRRFAETGELPLSTGPTVSSRPTTPAPRSTRPTSPWSSQ